MSTQRLLAVHAHPDDESLTMGGALALYHDRRVETAVVCCTDGRLGTIFAPDMPEATTRPRLASIRQDELRQACAILGVDEVHFLQYGDSGMAGEPTNHAPDAFWMTDIDSAVERLVGLIRTFRPQVVVTYDANGGYGHPDHIQTHRITLLAVEAAPHAMYRDAGPPWQVSKLYYTAFPLSAVSRAVDLATRAGVESPFGTAAPEELPFVTRDEAVTTTIECRDGILRKLDALRAHRSQIAPEWGFLSLPAELVQDHWSEEYFQLAMSRVPVDTPETDLFAGIVAAASG